METKKNPKVDVRRNSAIYFAIGMALTLMVANYAMNYQSQINNGDLVIVDPIDPPEEEKIPNTTHELPPPPPPPAQPDDFDIKDDEDDVVEDIVDDTEMDDETPIIDIEDIDDVIEGPEEIDVPFIAIEDAPVFPGCENVNNEAKKKCMSEKIQKFVKKKFNTDLAEVLGLTGRQRIFVMFKIDKKGNITGVQSRAPHPRLQKEAERVINLLPKMKPGKQQGVPVNVQYSLPIIFQVQD